MKKIAMTFAGALMALSFTSGGKIEALADFTRLCPVDYKCGVWWYEEAHPVEQCNAFRDYCLGINQCWADEGHFYEPSAIHYKENTIMPGYEHCMATAPNR